ncbi:unnamed protein product [Cylicocyclus nassatus]|uniref:Uncharacterized protein n=1 Tax=Cylicocyclus nassatus TaxID=53992 RepID=A0AA36DPV8_CYLNA|nr:unnamed protein product [Cylicocyclus nassatus]
MHKVGIKQEQGCDFIENNDIVVLQKRVKVHGVATSNVFRSHLCTVDQRSSINQRQINSKRIDTYLLHNH